MLSRVFKRNISTLVLPNITEKVYGSNDIVNNINHDLYFKKATIAILGYGPQGRAQSLNLRDQGYNVIIGLRLTESNIKKLEEDEWQKDKIMSINDACFNGTFITNLLSDAGQIETWSQIQQLLNPTKTLCFSHGFSVAFKETTKMIFPHNVPIILVAPKCSGATVRSNFSNNIGFASSYAVYKNQIDNNVEESKAVKYAQLIGANTIFETTFEKEAVSDLVGERSVLMGGIKAFFTAQYNVLRSKGHSPLEAYYETVYEALNSLYPLINQKGMSWMFQNCSTTAQRGAIDWSKEYEKAIIPILEKCYDQVKSQKEAQHVIKCNSDPEYRNKLNNELLQIDNEEIEVVGKFIRSIK